jgi:hypothetical protein
MALRDRAPNKRRPDGLRSARKDLEETFRRELSEGSIILFPIPLSADVESTYVHDVSQDLQKEFACDIQTLSNVKCLESNFGSGCGLYAIFIKDVPRELLRSALKRIEGVSASNQKDFLILDSVRPRITCHSFAHGEGHYYRFRYVQQKVEMAPEQLSRFLQVLPKACPEDSVFRGPRASAQELVVNCTLVHDGSHAAVAFAQRALRYRRFRSAHEDVEKYMAEWDPDTVATEVPVWASATEFRPHSLESLFPGGLTGHIDVLRVCGDGMIEILDYKPRAELEVNATLQVYLYAVLLSIRTGEPLTKFRCGYFDDRNAFLFSPERAFL